MLNHFSKSTAISYISCEASFSQTPQVLSRLYLDKATLVWNGNAVSGQDGLVEFFEMLPSSEFQVTTFDCQPVHGKIFCQGDSAVTSWEWNACVWFFLHRVTWKVSWLQWCQLRLKVFPGALCGKACVASPLVSCGDFHPYLASSSKFTWVQVWQCFSLPPLKDTR